MKIIGQHTTSTGSQVPADVGAGPAGEAGGGIQQGRLL
jgi:hypothetical protein